MALIKNRLTGHFGMVPNKLICDPRLCHGAVRLGAYLFGKPDGWDCENWKILIDLHIKDEETLSKYWKELVTVGWVYRARKRNSRGHVMGGFNIGLNDKLPAYDAGDTVSGVLPDTVKNRIRELSVSGKNPDTSHNNSSLHKNSSGAEDIQGGTPPPTSKKRKRFTPPTLDEVAQHVDSKGYDFEVAERFFNFYESKNWMVGKTKMSKWKSAIVQFFKDEDKAKKASKGVTQGGLNKPSKQLKYG